MYRGTEDKLSLQPEFNVASWRRNGCRRRGQIYHGTVCALPLLNAITIQTVERRRKRRTRRSEGPGNTNSVQLCENNGSKESALLFGSWGSIPFATDTDIVRAFIQDERGKVLV